MIILHILYIHPNIHMTTHIETLQIILRLMGSEGGKTRYMVQSAVCDCLGEMVVKGMDAGIKVHLVQTMASVIQSSGILVHFEVGVVEMECYGS